VELGEIEAALRLHPAVGDAAVVVRETEASKRIVAYLRRADRGSVHPDPKVDSLRRFLATRLADYMTPGWYVWLDEFPVTPTGKLDRGALPIPGVVRPSLEQEFEAPRGIERRLARLWRAELQIDRIGRHDDFISSVVIRSARSCCARRSRREEFESQLPHTSFCDLRRSPCWLHVWLWARIIPAVPHDRHAAGRRLLAAAVSATFDGRRRASGVTSSRLWDQNVQVCTSRFHRRRRFERFAGAGGAGPELVAFQPEGPYHLAGYSFSAAIAFEMAQQLLASGREVGVWR
jgi:hypothetical protein